MKPKFHHLRRFLALAGSAVLTITHAHAADGTWNSDVTNGLWSTDTNWLSNAIADSSGSTANFTNNITGDRTVRLDGDRTLTSVVFGDSDTSSAGLDSSIPRFLDSHSSQRSRTHFPPSKPQPPPVPSISIFVSISSASLQSTIHNPQ